MKGLVTYQEQVAFAKAQLRRGKVTEAGKWYHGRAWGKIWGGIVDGFYVRFETIGDGPYMRAGSFHVRALSQEENQ